MSAKANARFTEATGGQLKFIQTFKPRVNDFGMDIDFAALELEDNRKKCNHLEILNTGSKVCMIGFDTQASTLDCEDLTSFNFEVLPNEYKIVDGEADSVSMRTNPGEKTNLRVIVW